MTRLYDLELRRIVYSGSYAECIRFAGLYQEWHPDHAVKIVGQRAPTRAERMAAHGRSPEEICIECG